MVDTTIVIMNGDDYLMTPSGDTVVFDTREEAEECQKKFGGEIEECILFCDHKINWKELNKNDNTNSELTPKEVLDNIIDELSRARDICSILMDDNEEEIMLLAGEGGEAETLALDIDTDWDRLDILTNSRYIDMDKLIYDLIPVFNRLSPKDKGDIMEIIYKQYKSINKQQ